MEILKPQLPCVRVVGALLQCCNRFNPISTVNAAKMVQFGFEAQAFNNLRERCTGMDDGSVGRAPCVNEMMSHRDTVEVTAAVLPDFRTRIRLQDAAVQTNTGRCTTRRTLRHGW